MLSQRATRSIEAGPTLNSAPAEPINMIAPSSGENQKTMKLQPTRLRRAPPIPVSLSRAPLAISAHRPPPHLLTWVIELAIRFTYANPPVEPGPAAKALHS
jgi:hypothetical protein